MRAYCLLFLIFLGGAWSAYYPDTVNQPCYDNRLRDLAVETIIRSTDEFDRLSARVAMLPAEQAAPLVTPLLAQWASKYLTPDFQLDAPVDGEQAHGRDAFVCWNIGKLLLSRLKYQSHTYGRETCQVVNWSPLVLQVNMTADVAGYTANTNFLPWPFLQFDKLKSSYLQSHVVFQLTMDYSNGGRLLINYKNEDFGNMVITCQHNCSYPGAPDFFGWTNGSAVQSLPNPNTVYNPTFPLPPNYITIRSPLPPINFTDTSCLQQA